MTDTINQDEINPILWRACDTFRGAVRRAQVARFVDEMAAFYWERMPSWRKVSLKGG